MTTKRSMFFRSTLAAALLTWLSCAPTEGAVAGPLEDLAVAYEHADYAGAYRIARPLAEKGNAVGQLSLQVAYFGGLGVKWDPHEGKIWSGKFTTGDEPRDYTEVASWCSKLAAHGVPIAQYELAILYINGYGVQKNYEKANKLINMAAEHNLSLALFSLGSDYNYGNNNSRTKKDVGRAMKLFLSAASQGLPPAMAAVAGIYRFGGGSIKKNLAESAKWYRRAADNGDTFSMNVLGDMYEKGEGVPLSCVEALKWHHQAIELGYVDPAPQTQWSNYCEVVPIAEMGNPDAQMMAGFLADAEHRDNEAISWYRKAADNGHVGGQVKIGEAYAFSKYGVAKDHSMAMQWFRKAAGNGSALAFFYIGMFYNDGSGVPQDFAEAARWLQNAADLGYPGAQLNLAVMYGTGKGVPLDIVQAHKWANIAASEQVAGELVSANPIFTENRDRAAKLRTLLETRMTPAQIAEAQAAASAFRPIIARTVQLDADVGFSKTASTAQTSSAANRARVPLEKSGGTFFVPVLVNGAIPLRFVVDSGAADVTLPEDVVSTLMRTGTLKESDFTGKQVYMMADGSKAPSATFTLKSLKVGDTAVENIKGSVAPKSGMLLLGQSFLTRFKSWSIDNATHELVLE